MTTETLNKMAEDLFSSVRGWCRKNVLEPLDARLKTLEARQPEKGDQGEIGPIGEKGLTGDRGEPGPRGEKGDAGAPGLAGDRGEKGERGEQGPKGDPGGIGERGEKGEQGDRGEPGISIKGEQGDTGERGPQGEKGLDGKDADPELVERLVAERVEKMLPDLVQRAADALSLQLRETAVTVRSELGTELRALVKEIPPGKDADPEQVLRMVREAVALVPVPKDGKDGAPGRDAPTLEQMAPVLEAFVAQAAQDMAKDIPAGRDGRDGSPGAPGENGRDGIGIEDIDLGLRDGGEVVISARLANGEIVERSIILEGWPTYEGTYEPGRTYRRRASMTYGGSVWIAKRETSTSPPGDDWQLAVKGTR
jgi:hypothetical protein